MSLGLDLDMLFTFCSLMGGVALDVLSIGLIMASAGRPTNRAMAASAGRVMSCPDGLMSLQLSTPLLAMSKEVATDRKHISARPGMGCTSSRSSSISSS